MAAMYLGRHFFRYPTSSLLNLLRMGFVNIAPELDAAEGLTDIVGGK